MNRNRILPHQRQPLTEQADPPIPIAISADCPRCHNAIVVRRRRADGSSFLGCDAWPGCSFTAPFDQLTQALGERIVELEEQLAMAMSNEDLLEAEVAELRAKHQDPLPTIDPEPMPVPGPRVISRARRRGKRHEHGC